MTVDQHTQAGRALYSMSCLLSRMENLRVSSFTLTWLTYRDDQL